MSVIKGKKLSFPETFRTYHQVVSLFFETLLPYLKNKIVLIQEKYRKLAKFLQTLVYLSEFSLFYYQFRYLIDPKFMFFKPYFQLFGIIVRPLNQFEQGISDKAYKKRPLLMLLQQYSIFILFMGMKWCEWYFS